MAKAVIILEDSLVDFTNVISQAREVTDVTDLGITISTTEVDGFTQIVPATPVEDFVNLREALQGVSNVTFMVTPNQFSYVKFLATQILDDFNITFEYVPVMLRGSFYHESVNAYTAHMVQLIQDFDGIEPGDMPAIKNLIQA